MSTFSRNLYNCTAIVLGIAIVVSGLSPVTPAPAGTESSTVWLRNPCGKLAPIRHGRSPPENQLKIFINKIESLYKDIRSLHNAGNKSLKSQSCSRINNMLKPLKEAKNVAMANKAFFETMLQIGEFIEKLKNIPIKSTVKFNISKRNKIYNETADYLRSVICEYEDIVLKNEKRGLNFPSPNVPKMNTKCLPKTLDASEAQMYDIDFFKKLKKLFRQSRRFLKSKKQKGGKKSGKGGKKLKKRTQN